MPRSLLSRRLPAATALLAAAALALAGPARAEPGDVSATTPAATTPAATTPQSETLPAPLAPTPPALVEVAPVSPPAAPATPAGIEAAPPTLAIASVHRALGDARRHGLAIGFTVGEHVHLAADLMLASQVTDEDLYYATSPAAGPGYSLGRATIKRTAAGRNVVRVQFDEYAGQVLGAFIKVTLRVRLIATAADGAQTTVSRRIVLKAF